MYLFLYLHGNFLILPKSSICWRNQNQRKFPDPGPLLSSVLTNNMSEKKIRKQDMKVSDTENTADKQKTYFISREQHANKTGMTSSATPEKTDLRSAGSKTQFLLIPIINLKSCEQINNQQIC